MTRLAVLTDGARSDGLEAFVERHEATASVLILATEAAALSDRQTAARLEREHPSVVHLDLAAGHLDARQVRVNTARMFPVDAVVVLTLDETLVVDDADLLQLSLLEAGSRAVRIRVDPDESEAGGPDRLEGRVFPSSPSQLGLVLGEPRLDRRLARSPHDLAGARIRRPLRPPAGGSSTSASHPRSGARAAGEEEASARLETRQHRDGTPVTASRDLAPGVFDPEFHTEQLYLDLPPFKYVMNVCRPSSVLDIGCGLGGYLAFFGESGIGRTFGVDGFPEPEDYLDPGRYARHDLRQRLDLKERFDLVICTEVIEHIPPEYAAVILDSIDRHAQDFILFSGARPGQLGVDHINLRSTEHWIREWQLRGWRPDVFRTLAVRSLSTFHWFRRNLLVLSRSVEANAEFGIADLASFEAAMVDWVGQDASIIRHPLALPLAPVRTGPVPERPGDTA